MAIDTYKNSHSAQGSVVLQYGRRILRHCAQYTQYTAVCCRELHCIVETQSGLIGRLSFRAIRISNSVLRKMNITNYSVKDEK